MLLAKLKEWYYKKYYNFIGFKNTVYAEIYIYNLDDLIYHSSEKCAYEWDRCVYRVPYPCDQARQAADDIKEELSAVREKYPEDQYGIDWRVIEYDSIYPRYKLEGL